MSLRVELNKELERKFREMAMKRYGYVKGSIKKATEVAIKKWTQAALEDKKNIKAMEDPIKLIEGTLSHLKGRKTSVQLQHAAIKIWSERALHYKKRK